MLAKYEKGVGLPPPSNIPVPIPPEARPESSSSLLHPLTSQQQQQQPSASAPIAIGGRNAHWRGGHSTSPMESDDGDGGAFPLSRSWDDIEGAKSILNLNSPNGFHPLAGPLGGQMPPPAAFSLPTPTLPAFPPHHSSGSSMLGPGSGSSMLGISHGSMMSHGTASS